MELDPSSPLARDVHLADTEKVSLDLMEPVTMEEGKETSTEGSLEEDEEEEEIGRPLGQLTSSRMGNVSATESSQMFLSLLAEGSSIRYDSSMQVCVRTDIEAYILLFIFYFCMNKSVTFTLLFEGLSNCGLIRHYARIKTVMIQSILMLVYLDVSN